MARLSESLATFEFTSPLVFWVGSVLLLLVIFVPFSNKKMGLAFNLGYWQSKVALKNQGEWVLPALIVLITILMAMIVADPHVRIKKTTAIYGKPVMVVIDVSGSMEYRGLAGKDGISAREKARLVLDDILSRGIEADLGLLIYSTENYIARSYTIKEALFKDTLENDEEISLIATGTRTSEALATARLFLLKKEDTQDKAIVLVSDLESDLEAIMELAEEVDRDLTAGIKVYAILTDGEDRWSRQKPADQMATAGMKIVGMNDKAGIDRLCAEINAMESSPIRDEESLVEQSLVPYLIPSTVGLVVLCLVLSETVYRKVP